MGANSKIEWTDHTFNPWIGCTRIDNLEIKTRETHNSHHNALRGRDGLGHFKSAQAGGAL